MSSHNIVTQGAELQQKHDEFMKKHQLTDEDRQLMGGGAVALAEATPQSEQPKLQPETALQNPWLSMSDHKKLQKKRTQKQENAVRPADSLPWEMMRERDFRQYSAGLDEYRRADVEERREKSWALRDGYQKVLEHAPTYFKKLREFSETFDSSIKNADTTNPQYLSLINATYVDFRNKYGQESDGERKHNQFATWVAARMVDEWLAIDAVDSELKRETTAPTQVQQNLENRRRALYSAFRQDMGAAYNIPREELVQISDESLRDYFKEKADPGEKFAHNRTNLIKFHSLLNLRRNSLSGNIGNTRDDERPNIPIASRAAIYTNAPLDWYSFGDINDEFKDLSAFAQEPRISEEEAVMHGSPAKGWDPYRAGRIHERAERKEAIKEQAPEYFAGLIEIAGTFNEDVKDPNGKHKNSWQRSLNYEGQYNDMRSMIEMKHKYGGEYAKTASEVSDYAVYLAARLLDEDMAIKAMSAELENLQQTNNDFEGWQVISRALDGRKREKAAQAVGNKLRYTVQQFAGDLKEAFGNEVLHGLDLSGDWRSKAEQLQTVFGRALLPENEREDADRQQDVSEVVIQGLQNIRLKTMSGSYEEYADDTRKSTLSFMDSGKLRDPLSPSGAFGQFQDEFYHN